MRKIDYSDPMSAYKSRPTAKIVTHEQATRKHEEADLHLAFCRWVKLQYPKLDFIRHEREKARSPFLQNLMKMYNSENDKMPDFECLTPMHGKCRLYIEFKKPGTKLTLRDNVTIKPEYSGQYTRHLAFFSEGSPAYFATSLEQAQEQLRAYVNGCALPAQVFRR